MKPGCCVVSLGRIRSGAVRPGRRPEVASDPRLWIGHEPGELDSVLVVVGPRPTLGIAVIPTTKALAYWMHTEARQSDQAS